MLIAMEPNIGVGLPQEVIIEILSWLPVKTLLQFRCVCKSWYAIITSSMFISKHLGNYSKNSDSDCFLAQNCESEGVELFELLVNETSNKAMSSLSLAGVPEHINACTHGPCDGIFYLYFYLDYRALWNPATNEMKLLPRLIMNSNQPSDEVKYSLWDMVFGFGLDPTTKDYKVIVIKGYRREAYTDEESRYPLSAFVYSLRTNSWRQITSVLARYYYLEQNKCYVCRNGVFYWLGSFELEGDSEVIISFDIASDLFQEMKLPNHESGASKGLTMYHDSIAFCHVKKEILNLWTLNEQCCWTKLLAIGPFLGLRNPVGYWKNDKIVLEFESDHYKLALCDLRTQEIMELGFRGENWCIVFFIYQGSLVSFKDRSWWLQYEEAKTIAKSRKLKKKLDRSGMVWREWHEYE